MIKVKLTPEDTNIYGLYLVGQSLICEVDCTDGNASISLPDVENYEGEYIIFVKTDSSSNTVTISGTSGQTINGTTVTLSSQYDSALISAGDSNWYKIN